jgi:hypothetical protein
MDHFPSVTNIMPGGCMNPHPNHPWPNLDSLSHGHHGHPGNHGHDQPGHVDAGQEHVGQDHGHPFINGGVVGPNFHPSHSFDPGHSVHQAVPVIQTGGPVVPVEPVISGPAHVVHHGTVTDGHGHSVLMM